MSETDYEILLNSDLGQWLEQMLPKLPDGSPDRENEKAEPVHDLIAELAEQISGLKSQQSHLQEDCRQWLDAILSSKRSMLPKKLASKRWIEIEPDDFIIECRNRKVKFTDSEIIEVVKRLRRSREQLDPITLRIKVTQRLVEMIVYRLYGLTPSEAAHVDDEVTLRR
ncbi:MAG: hypothetical protein WCO51_00595 [bacterium]